MKKLFLIACCTLAGIFCFAQNGKIKLALLHYSGGGDWYNDVHSLRNLARFCNEHLNTDFDEEYATVESGNPDIFNYPFVYMTGHGNFTFTEEEADNMRKYLEGGGFLFINDDYGIDPFVRPALKKIFPDLTLVELPYSDPLFHEVYPFPNGIPKIHEHAGLPPQSFGLFYQGRLVVYYDYEADLGDGWDDVFKDTEEKRTQALEMGANIIQYVFTENLKM